jgi:hypothetical protein
MPDDPFALPHFRVARLHRFRPDSIREKQPTTREKIAGRYTMWGRRHPQVGRRILTKKML